MEMISRRALLGTARRSLLVRRPTAASKERNSFASIEGFGSGTYRITSLALSSGEASAYFAAWMACSFERVYEYFLSSILPVLSKK